MTGWVGGPNGLLPPQNIWEWVGGFAPHIFPLVFGRLEIVDVGGSTRPPASSKTTGKGGGLRPPPFSVGKRGKGPFGPPNNEDFRPDFENKSCGISGKGHVVMSVPGVGTRDARAECVRRTLGGRRVAIGLKTKG